MSPAYNHNNFVVTTTLFSSIKYLDVDDVVVYSDYSKELHVKRIYGIPNDTIWFNENKLLKTTNDLESLNCLQNLNYGAFLQVKTSECQFYIVEKNYLYLVGDNLDKSVDSRHKGAIYSANVSERIIFKF